MKRRQTPSLFPQRHQPMRKRNAPTKPTTPVALPVAATVYKKKNPTEQRRTRSREHDPLEPANNNESLFASCPLPLGFVAATRRSPRQRPGAAAADLAEKTGIGAAARSTGPVKRGPALPVEFPRRCSARIRHPLLPTYVIFVLCLGSGVLVLIVDGLTRFRCC